jgi:hypothetical protein
MCKLCLKMKFLAHRENADSVIQTTGFILYESDGCLF